MKLGPRAWAAPRDRIGERFGYLTVTARADGGRWDCRCTCGGAITLPTTLLRVTRTCGCRTGRQPSEPTPTSAPITSASITASQAAELLGVTKQAMHSRRVAGSPPAWRHGPGRSVLYDRDEVLALRARLHRERQAAITETMLPEP